MKTSSSPAIFSPQRASSKVDFLLDGFAALLESSDQGYLLLDRIFNLVFSNEQANEIINKAYQLNIEKGNNYLAFAPKHRKAKIEETLARVLDGQTIQYEVEFTNSPGRTVFIDCKYSPVKTKMDEVIGICIVLKDITDKKELEASKNLQKQIEEKHRESLQLFEQFMENSPLRAWITDEQGFVHYMNPLHRKFLQLDGDYAGKNLSDIFPEQVAKEYAADDMVAMHAGKAIAFLQRAKKPNGAAGIYKVYKFPIWVKNRLMIAGWAIEITKQAHLQKKLLSQERRNRRAVIRSIINTQEKERRQLSVELHDNVNQIISSCKLMLEVAKDNPGKRPELIEKSYQSLKEVIVEIREISHNLNPSALEDIGLVEAVAEMIERLNASGKFFIEFDHLRYRVKDLNADQRITIYRIIQEGLNNIIKYAAAEKVWITLYSNTTQVLVTIRDNGKGFDMNTTKKGLGLRNISYRVEYHHGHMKILTSPGNGCTLKVLLPIATV